MHDSYRTSRELGPWIALLLAIEAVAACSTSAPTTGPVAATGSVTAAASQSPAAANASPAASSMPAIPAGLLVFTLRTGSKPITSENIASVRTDDTAFARLTNDPDTLYKSPTWNAANRTLVFADERRTLGNVYSMSLDGSSRTKLTSGTLFDDNPSVSRDGTLLAFDRVDSNVASMVYVKRLNSPDVIWTSRPPKMGRGGDLEPAFSPDGSEIAFVHEGAVEIVRLDGHDLRELAPATYHAEDPHWSPDGRLIAFGDTDSGSAFLVDADGSTKPRQIDVPGWLLFQPSFSPDGRWLVANWFFKESGYGGIGVMPVDGHSPTLIHVMDDDAEVPIGPIWISLDQVSGLQP